MNLFNRENVKRINAENNREKVVGTRSKRDQSIFDAVNNGSWGCQDSSVRALVKVITGVDCTNPEKNCFVVGSMIVTRLNDGTSQTLLVRTLDSDGDARFFTNNGETEDKDSNSYIETGSDWRYATDAEIDVFFGD